MSANVNVDYDSEQWGVKVPGLSEPVACLDEGDARSLVDSAKVFNPKSGYKVMSRPVYVGDWTAAK